MTPRGEWLKAAMAIYRLEIGDEVIALLRQANLDHPTRALAPCDVEEVVRGALLLPNGGEMYRDGGNVFGAHQFNVWTTFVTATYFLSDSVLRVVCWKNPAWGDSLRPSTVREHAAPMSSRQNAITGPYVREVVLPPRPRRDR